MHAISFSRWTCAFCTSCQVGPQTIVRDGAERRESKRDNVKLAIKKKMNAQAEWACIAYRERMRLSSGS